MSLPFKTDSFVLSSMLIFTVLCVLPLIFSSGCNFDPYQDMAVSDTVTYNVSGTVCTNGNTPIKTGIRVCLFDSVSSNRSSFDITDTLGQYSITWPYLRRSTLRLIFDDIESTNDSYASDSAVISFDANYFKYGFQKTQDIRLEKEGT
jgi:hypothetical protein